MGYDLAAVEEKQTYSADFFQSNDDAISLEKQIAWLQKEHEIAQKQLRGHTLE